MRDLVPARLADRIAWGAVALGAGVLGVALALYWGANPGHADRLLILLGSGYAAAALAPGWKRIPARPRPALGLPVALAGWAGFAAGAFLLVQAGPRTLLLWWLAGSLVAAAAGVGLTRAGAGRVRAALFPLLFPLFALPVPLRVLNPVQDALQDATTGLSYRALSAAGLDVERTEFVLSLPGGKLRVEEACSGVRSLTALTALAAFVAFWCAFGPARGVALVLLSVPIVALVNAVRVVLSGFIQEWVGPEYIRGDWHEGLGFLMIFVGLGLILAVAGRLAPRPPEAAPDPGPAADAPRGGWAAAAVGVFGVGLVAWGLLGGRTTAASGAETAPLADMAADLPGGWRGRDLPVPPVVADLLEPDVTVYRRYENNVGQPADVWAFYWRTGAAIKGYHHPDVCWGNNGFAAASKWGEPVAPGVDATAREFRRPDDPVGAKRRGGGGRQVVLYWTQEGRHVWTDADEWGAKNDMLSSSWTGHQWVGDLLGAGGRSAGPRLQAVVIVPGDGPSARKAAAAVGRAWAAELYRVCPWAAP